MLSRDRCHACDGRKQTAVAADKIAVAAENITVAASLEPDIPSVRGRAASIATRSHGTRTHEEPRCVGTEKKRVEDAILHGGLCERLGLARKRIKYYAKQIKIEKGKLSGKGYGERADKIAVAADKIAVVTGDRDAERREIAPYVTGDRDAERREIVPHVPPARSQYGLAAAAAIENSRPTPQQANPPSDAFCQLMFDQMMEFEPMAKKERYCDGFGRWNVAALETALAIVKYREAERREIAPPVTSPYGPAAAAAIENSRPRPQQQANPPSDAVCQLMFDQMMEFYPMAKKERYCDGFGRWSLAALETDLAIIKHHRIWSLKHMQRSGMLATAVDILAVGPRSPSHPPPRESTSRSAM